MEETYIKPAGQTLFSDLSALIEQSRNFVAVQANSVMTMLFWNVGKRINEDVLQNRRAEYGRQIVATLATQLSWTHFVEILPLKNEKARMFYAREAAERSWGKRQLRQSAAGNLNNSVNI
jgi:hypothetical protein